MYTSSYYDYNLSVNLKLLQTKRVFFLTTKEWDPSIMMQRAIFKKCVISENTGETLGIFT